MIKNYFKIAWRNLSKTRFYTAINISGLAVGLATGIMLLLWIENELSYDRFHKEHKNIYELSSHFRANGEEITWTGVPGPLAVYSRSIPEVQSIVRIQKEYDQMFTDKKNNKVYSGNIVAAVDSGFFFVFDFSFVKGNRENVFPDINSVVITSSTAKKIFGDQEPIGQMISYYDNNFTVTGVLQDFPENSTLHFDAVFPMGFYAKLFTEWGGNGSWKTIDEDLGNYSFDAFVKLQPGADPVKTGRAFSDLYKKARNGDSDASFQLQNLGDIHLVTADGNQSALRMVRIFFIVVILLLAIASINYVNLSTARSLARAKEVSIRKIIGAEKRQLFFQFTLETILLFFFATAISVVLIYLLMPLYNDISGKSLSFSITESKFWKVATLAISGTLIAASIYPAFLLSSFKPIEAIKGKFAAGIGAPLLRKVLVVFQFSIAVILLVSTIIMGKQMKFVKNKDLGYDKSYVFTAGFNDEAKSHLDAIKSELIKQPGIVNVAVSDVNNISNVESSTSDLEWEGKPDNSNLIISQLYADKDFIPAMKIDLIEGGNFTGTPADTAYFILNETAVKTMGLKKPYVGQPISFHGRKGTIKGVTKDFNFQSLHQKISPLLIYNLWNNGRVLYIRTTASNVKKAIEATERQYKKYAGSTPFSYNFLDKAFAEQYKSEQRSGTLFQLFAGIAIFISCLGLLGLVTYTAHVKVKEIGIRKILGASVTGIVTMISKDFVKLIIIAILIASPVAWWVMNKWLQNFAYKTDIGWWIFLLAGIVALLIAFITVSFQAIKAAIANPVKSLRTE